MKVDEVIAISSSSGTIKAGLESFIRLFKKRTDIKTTLNISDEQLEIITSTVEIMDRIYKKAREEVKIDK